MKTVSIACGADNRYAMPMAMMLYSALQNFSSKHKLQIFVVDGGINEKNWNKIKNILNSAKTKSYKLTRLSPAEDSFIGPIKRRNFSSAAYLRLDLPYILPEEIEKVIYLDSDVIVEGDLAALWKIELEGAPVLASQDYTIQVFGHRKGIRKYRQLHYRGNEPYFNSGVMVMNLEYWREHQVSQRVVDYLYEYEDHLNFHDQEGLNVILAGKWRILDPAWNQMPKIYDSNSMPENAFKNLIRYRIDELKWKPKIIHYTTTRKPWFFKDHPLTDRFWFYLRHSHYFTTFGLLKLYIHGFLQRNLKRMYEDSVKLSAFMSKIIHPRRSLASKKSAAIVK